MVCKKEIQKTEETRIADGQSDALHSERPDEEKSIARGKRRKASRGKKRRAQLPPEV